MRDWCISRQIWWGHRIPAWHCQDCGHITVTDSDGVEACEHCGSHNVEQDPDVLDTWFSSALWPFSTLGWPEQTAELARYYPTSTLITDRGIIYFWVARMVMMGLYQTDQRPFDDVYIHGTVLDETGAKMSKSLKNGIDPLVMIAGGSMDFCPGGWRSPKDDKKIQRFESPGYGADAVRYTLLDMTTEGQDLKLSPNRFEAGRNFANKMFNAGRFLLMNLAERPLPAVPTIADLRQHELGFAEEWLLHQLNQAITQCHDSLDRFRFSDYVSAAYRFFRDDLCDWYLEWAKAQFKAGGAAADTAAAVLCHSFDQALRLLHPGMPYITELLWQQLQQVTGNSAWQDDAFLMLSSWPQADASCEQPVISEQMTQLQQLVSTIRDVRASLGLPEKQQLDVIVEAGSNLSALEQAHSFVADRANAHIQLGSGIDFAPESHKGIDAVVGASRLRVIIADDQAELLTAYLGKLEKQLKQKEQSANGKRGRLSNERYVNNAPPEKVQETRDMLAAEEAEIAQLQASIAALQ